MEKGNFAIYKLDSVRDLDSALPYLKGRGFDIQMGDIYDVDQDNEEVGFFITGPPKLMASLDSRLENVLDEYFKTDS